MLFEFVHFYGIVLSFGFVIVLSLRLSLKRL